MQVQFGVFEGWLILTTSFNYKNHLYELLRINYGCIIIHYN